MRNANAEHEAEVLLAAAEAGGPPINLDAVLRLWPLLDVSECDMEGDGAFVDLGEQGGCILLKRATGRERKRFTLAHELGHYLLKSKFGVECSLDDRDAERWCDEFAANLLIPRSALERHLKRDSSKPLALAVFSGPSAFQVSVAAFRRRVTDVTGLGVWDVRSDSTSVTIVEKWSTDASRECASWVNELARQLCTSTADDRLELRAHGRFVSAIRFFKQGLSQSWLMVGRRLTAPGAKEFPTSFEKLRLVD